AVCGLGNGGGLVVADVRVECGDEHQAAGEVGVDLSAVDGQTGEAVVRKAPHRVGEQPRAVEEIVDHHRVEHVQLKVALAGGESDGGIVSHDLDGHHGHGLALGRVDLAGHDR